MLSLRQIIAEHGPILVLDAASTQVQVGLLRADVPGIWRESGEEAGKGLFAGVAACLEAAGCELDAINGFVFCDGPGSMLGIRTAAMAIRTWLVLRPRNVFRYSSLGLIAHHMARSERHDFSVIADARRETWHAVVVRHGSAEAPQRIPNAELGTFSGRLFLPRVFRVWTTPSRPTEDVSYTISTLFEAGIDAPLFSATEAPDGFQAEPPVYKKWTAQVHSMDTAARP